MNRSITLERRPLLVDSCKRLGLVFVLGLIAIPSAAVDVSIVPIGGAFAANSMNHVAFRQNSLKTIGDQQFAAYYDDNGLVTVARRTHGSAQWDEFSTIYTDNNSGLTDDHNVIAFGVDGDGYMHLSWGMHNDDLRYIKSTQPVTGAAPIAFGAEIDMVAPLDEGLVTYPQFYDLPGGDLLFMYRTGGSGNGDTQVNRYDNATASWSALHRPLFDGSIAGDGLPSVNNYPNTLAFDSQGAIHFSWTVRDTPDFQTNKNLYYAKSTDNGATWQRSDGSFYPLPFGEIHSEIAVAIPEQSSLINQASMTTDANDLPVMATWWAPGAQQGNHTRQYMLVYNDGTDWQTSQITNRAPEPKQGASTVRDLARPIVVVDDEDRVIVAMRYDERGDVITIAHSEDRVNWDFVDLSTEGLGTYEPNYDVDLWKRENKLHLLYQPVGLGQANSTLSVLEWDARAYFAGLNAPKLSLSVDRSSGRVTIVNASDAAVEADSFLVSSPSGQLDPAGWIGLSDQGVTGWQTETAGPTQLSEQGPTALSFPAGASVGIGSPYANGVAFGVDGPEDLTFTYSAGEGEPVTATVKYVGESSNNLTLFVNAATGAARLENTSAFSVAIDGYRIVSDSAGLRPSQWVSLANAAGGDWEEANPSPNSLAELLPNGELSLVGDDGFDLGAPFDPTAQQDLIFEYLVVGESTPRRGVVRYQSLTATLEGDYNADGIVDAADYTVWRDQLDQFATLPGDVTPGLVSLDDYARWRDNFGATLAPNVAGVPEPVGIVGLVVAVLLQSMRRGHPL
ncbi:hypothetical protein Pla108_17910 [Botrimarina colliarenosi]|uniref:Uncharacterized protein n=1 Tax=Botrimarina colliarenosi TaxID=2528001 RepID=A0A5C6ADF4_9BACT|nr:BNR repeat-containing protein [Botrimarina colliarenosi]TWT97639.1 hypothetical protein Pla108_17910 [Botrimarina colliarenosi]